MGFWNCNIYMDFMKCSRQQHNLNNNAAIFIFISITTLYNILLDKVLSLGTEQFFSTGFEMIVLFYSFLLLGFFFFALNIRNRASNKTQKTTFMGFWNLTQTQIDARS